MHSGAMSVVMFTLIGCTMSWQTSPKPMLRTSMPCRATTPQATLVRFASKRTVISSPFEATDSGLREWFAKPESIAALCSSADEYRTLPDNRVEIVSRIPVPLLNGTRQCCLLRAALCSPPLSLAVSRHRRQVGDNSPSRTEFGRAILGNLDNRLRDCVRDGPKVDTGPLCENPGRNEIDLR